jgi:hypothetical protein
VSARPVAVVGAYGAVGRAACAQLVAWGIGPLRVGGRDGTRAGRLAAELAAGGDPVEAGAVDVTDGDSLARFVEGSRAVLNCAGPAALIGDRVARAARAAGVDYVDAAGDDELYAAMTALDWPAGRRVVISAGMMPGLTGLLPRALAAGFGPVERLTGYVGGRDRFTVTAAHDFLSTLDGFGVAYGVWRDGAVVAGAATPLAEATVPGFPGPVSGTPYLSTEAMRVAAELAAAEATWYSVFAGERLRAAITRAGTGDQAAAELSRAADLDLFGAARYQTVTVVLAGADGAARTLVLRGTGASELTGCGAALAVRAVVDGSVEPGVHHAAEALDARKALVRLADCLAVGAIEVFDGEPAGDEVEEGAL